MNNYRPDNRKDKGLFKQALAASQLGLHMVLATVVGLAMGFGLDKLFDTKPLLTIIFLLIGIAAGFLELFRFARKQEKE
jgi:ATP synthase protein I